MSPHETDRRHFERQILYARPIIIVLSILAILDWPASADSHRCLYFLSAYFLYSLVVIALELLLSDREWYSPLAIDLALIVILIYLSPFAVPIWFPYLFASYASGSRWGLRTAMPVAAVLALLITFLNVFERDA